VVDLGRVALAAIDVVTPTAAAKGVQLHAEIDEGPVSMKGDPDRLQQVVWNLLSNAIKFTDAGGRVAVRVAPTQPGVLTLSVSDTGEGIPDAFLPQLFERFRQADSSAGRRHGGLGIGLSLVRQLVELHGGRITATSTVGEGATFIVTFPAWSGAGDQDAGIPDTPSLAGIRVLVAAADDDSRELLTVALEQCGAQVTVVSHAADGIDLLRSARRSERPQVIVADARGDEGASLVRALRESRSPGIAIPAVAVISSDHARNRQRALAAGFGGLVPMPISPQALAVAVRDLLGQY
jgi:CheY-like chemotaxis protein